MELAISGKKPENQQVAKHPFTLVLKMSLSRHFPRADRSRKGTVKLSLAAVLE